MIEYSYFWITAAAVLLVLFVWYLKRKAALFKSVYDKPDEKTNEQISGKAVDNGFESSAEFDENKIKELFSNFLSVNLESIIAKRVQINEILCKNSNDTALLLFSVFRYYTFPYSMIAGLQKTIVSLLGRFLTRRYYYAGIVLPCSLPHILLKPVSFGSSVSGFALGKRVFKENPVSEKYLVYTSDDKKAAGLLTRELTELLLLHEYCIEIQGNAVSIIASGDITQNNVEQIILFAEKLKEILKK